MPFSQRAYFLVGETAGGYQVNSCFLITFCDKLYNGNEKCVVSKAEVKLFLGVESRKASQGLWHWAEP